MDTPLCQHVPLYLMSRHVPWFGLDCLSVVLIHSLSHLIGSSEETKRGSTYDTSLAKEGKLPTFLVRKHQPRIFLCRIYLGPFPKWTGYTRAFAYLNASFA